MKDVCNRAAPMQTYLSYMCDLHGPNGLFLHPWLTLLMLSTRGELMMK